LRSLEQRFSKSGREKEETSGNAVNADHIVNAVMTGMSAAPDELSAPEGEDLAQSFKPG
jgi:hypothetical protein